MRRRLIRFGSLMTPLVLAAASTSCGDGGERAASTQPPATTTIQPPATTTTLPPALPFGDELQTIVDDAVEPDDAIGFSLAVMVPGYETWVGVAGEAEPGVPLASDMSFSGGSIAKNFIAALVLQLAEEGKLSLDDRLADWLPDYLHVDGAITIRQLLNHTGGVFTINHHPDFWSTVFTEVDREWTDVELFSLFLAEPYFSPGASWHYSNTGYILLGQIIEASTGSTVSAELRDRFFEPLHLNTAFYYFEEAAPGSVVEGWFDISRYAPDADPAPGVLEPYSEFPWTRTMPEAGGVFASPEDLAAWARALFHDRSVLGPESMDEMLDFVPMSPEAEESALVAGYGLGAITYQPELFGGVQVIGHSGGDPFYSAASVYLPEYGVAIGAAENIETEDAFGTAMMQVVDIITRHVEPIP
jgi:D-alanyl-D-alanine carboxypeptidase